VSIEVERFGGDGALVRPEAALDYAAAGDLDDVLTGLVEGGVRRLAVDLTAAAPLDDAAIGVLFRAVRTLRPRGGAVALAVSDPRLAEALSVMGLDRMFRVTATFQAALEAVGEPVAPPPGG
jgi:anti-sigma B factor antagonist